MSPAEPSGWGTPPGHEPTGRAPPPLPPSLLPDRSTTVLVLGLLGLLVCFACGIVAAVIGSGDLRAIRHGTRDPAGEGRTRTGMTLGIVGAILNGLVFLRVLAIWMNRSA